MNDPRSKINNYANTSEHTSYSDESYLNFYEIPPRIEDSRGKYWCGRGQNFIVIYCDLEKGAKFKRENQLDEFAIIQADTTTSLSIKSNNKDYILEGYTITFVPPGDSFIEITKSGRFLFLFSCVNKDLLSLCQNSDDYEVNHENIPEFKAWPMPKDGFKLRTYSLEVSEDPNRFGKIWRSTNFMVSFVPLQFGPRDITKLSPHSHDDFEQCSFVLDGEFTHHIRYPWTSNKNHWKEDKHITCKSPSMMVVPAKAIHTSCAIHTGKNQLIDIFSPPRHDFSKIPGWVLNSDDYPNP